MVHARLERPLLSSIVEMSRLNQLIGLVSLQVSLSRCSGHEVTVKKQSLFPPTQLRVRGRIGNPTLWVCKLFSTNHNGSSYANISKYERGLS